MVSETAFNEYKPDRGPGARALCITMIVLPAISVAFRFWSRAVLPEDGYGIDDWLALLGLVM